jgi:hypothetical protein
MKFFALHKKVFLKSLDLSRLPHVFLADMLSIVAILLTFVFFITLLGLITNQAAPAAESILAYQAGNTTQEQLVDQLITYEGTIQNALFLFIGTIILAIILLCGILALFRGISWSLIKRQHYDVQGFWKLFLVVLAYTFILLILATLTTIGILKTNITTGALLLTIFVLISLHFSPLLFSAFDPKKGFFKNLSFLYGKGIFKLLQYLFFYVLCIILLIIITLLIYLGHIIHEALGTVVFIILFYLYWLWFRNYHACLTREL